MLTHLSLFSGIGGIDLAAEWAGFTTVGQCEMTDYPHKVLCKHWPDVPKWRDVRDVTAARFHEATGLSTVSLVSAGYPCQTFSLAGKQEGDLALAEQFVRVVDELRPRWALGENVGGHITNGLDDVIRLFRDKGYAARPLVLRASDAGAPHERRRVFVLAYSGNESDLQKSEKTVSVGSQGGTRAEYSWRYWRTQAEPDWTICKPGLDRLVDGVSSWMERHKQRTMTGGNAVVPRQVYPILKAIAEIERS